MNIGDKVTRPLPGTSVRPGNSPGELAHSTVRVVALRLQRAFRLLDHKAVETLPSFRRSG
jgi:hypothetical protein